MKKFNLKFVNCRRNKFDTGMATYVDFNQIPRECKSLKIQLFNYHRWSSGLKCQLAKQGVAGSIPGGDLLACSSFLTAQRNRCK